MSRIVSWFSCGAASAVATKLAIKEHGDVTVARITLASEHADNERFADECATWFGRPIVNLQSTEYADTWDVWERTRFLVGPFGARCTTELKKMVRHGFEKADDLQVFGFTADKHERIRAKRFRDQSPELNVSFPLIEAGITKAECLAMIERAGIELPAMYRLGYQNNNCIGCVKGGMGYWNKIRVDFPDVFARMAKLERELGHTCIRAFGRSVYLDELNPEAGRYSPPQRLSCGLFCPAIEGAV